MGARSSFFDRLFGTFQVEEEEVVYGVTKPLKSWDPIWANLDYWRDIAKLIVRCRSPWDVVMVLVKGPGWRPSYLGGPQRPQPVSVGVFKKYDIQLPQGLSSYVLVQYIVILLGASAFLATVGELRKAYTGWEQTAWVFGLAALVLLCVANMGALLARKAWSPNVEAVRLTMMTVATAALVWKTDLYWLPLAIGGAWLALSMFWLSRFRGALGDHMVSPI